MPDRAIIALLPAISLGFICGIIGAALQLEPGPTLAVGVVGGALVLIAGLSSVFGVHGAAGEMAIVALLRAACAIGVFTCMYLFMLDFLRNAHLLRALLWLVVGAVLAIALSQLRVRDRGELRRAQPDA